MKQNKNANISIMFSTLLSTVLGLSGDLSIRPSDCALLVTMVFYLDELIPNFLISGWKHAYIATRPLAHLCDKR